MRAGNASMWNTLSAVTVCWAMTAVLLFGDPTDPPMTRTDKPGLPSIGISAELPARPPASGRPAVALSPPGIQWFTELKEGLAEAARTGRPILFVSAAPSCGGIPGNW